MKRIRRHLSYANVVATLALVLAVAGGASAMAVIAGKNSVTTKSIRPGNVTASDLAGVRVVRAEVTIGVVTGAATARCPRADRVIGGGVLGIEDNVILSGSFEDANGWTARGRTSAGTSQLRVEAHCLRQKPSRAD